MAWQLVNLCVIAVVLAVPISSGFSLPLSPEPSSLTPPLEVQGLTPEPGPLLNGPIVQPPVVSPPHDSPPPQAAETPQQQPHVSTPPSATTEPPHDSTLSPTPIIEPPQPIMTPPPPPEGQPVSSSSPIQANASSPQPHDDDFALSPLTLPLPLDPVLPSPSPSFPSEPPHKPSPISLPIPPPLAMPPVSLPSPPELPHISPSPPPIELPHISPPPPPIELPHISPSAPPIELPHISPPPPLIMSSLAPPPLVVPPHAPSYAPPPSPAMQESVPVVPPPASPTEGSGHGAHSRAPPPAMPDQSPEPLPSSTISPVGAPPVNRTMPVSHPPISHQIEAPKDSPPYIMRSNVSEPHAPPLSAAIPLAAPPSRPPVQLSPAADPLPHRESHLKAPSEPKYDRQNETAPAPFSFEVPPPSGGSHFLSSRSPVKGSPPVAEVPSASTSEIPEVSNAPSPTPTRSSGHSVALLSPKFSPSGSSTRHTKRPVAPPIHALPPPPPNQDCAYLTCPEPYTNTPPGSPCGCVWPMQVGLRLSVPLYTFFPLVTDLTREIAPGVFMKQSQVRVVGAKEAAQEPEKTIVLVDLVPFDKKFDDITASSTSQRFWHKQVHIDKSIFGDYDILYVQYPGLPPSPPMAPADIAVVNSIPYSVGDTNGSRLHPLGVVLPELRHKDRLHASLVAVIVFSAIVGVMICFSVAWILILRFANHKNNSLGRSSGSGPSSSLSLEPSLAEYPGSAKTFSASEIEKATDNFSPSRVVGEGGFGCVYSGTLEDGSSVAVKVLKRDDQQGGREFLAELQMLKRVHHRNLVKLIGICVDDNLRCLVYELVRNGSVESHLHGADKETSPLDWSSRLKIALGAARGLAYLHEDSSPGIIHRDFKASNILLEDDFTPKVSDFGLARIAPMDEESRHITTQIMGTFGYVAPEYAMTGHLLVKSDVYSYGVVLLELLTGRKPVDMSQPPGEENLVAWARPLLTSEEGLESIIDPSLLGSSDIIKSFDYLAKVASIASMCVQPEVSHRPFMGEVVQALKLVYNECECGDDDSKDGKLLDENNGDPSEAQLSLERYLMSECDLEKGVCEPHFLSMSVGSGGERSGSSRRVRLSASGPMRSAKGLGFWKSMRKMSPGSHSEHGTMYRTLWPGSH